MIMAHSSRKWRVRLRKRGRDEEDIPELSEMEAWNGIRGICYLLQGVLPVRKH